MTHGTRSGLAERGLRVKWDPAVDYIYRLRTVRFFLNYFGGRGKIKKANPSCFLPFSAYFPLRIPPPHLDRDPLPDSFARLSESIRLPLSGPSSRCRSIRISYPVVAPQPHLWVRVSKAVPDPRLFMSQS